MGDAWQDLVDVLAELESNVRSDILDWTEATRAQHPDVRIEATLWWAYLCRHLDDVAPVDYAGHLAPLRGADMWLACAAAHGNSSAMRSIESLVAHSTAQTVRRYPQLRSEEDELRQQLWIRLLIAQSSRPPKMLQYAGRGSLAGWIHTAAVRLALNVLDQAKNHEQVDDTVSELLAHLPETRRLHQEQREIFVENFRVAFAAIDLRGRTLLRLHLVQRMSLAELGRSYGVDRSTASRWVSAAFEKLSTRFSKSLPRKGRDELRRDLMSALRSSFELSLRDLLKLEP